MEKIFHKKAIRNIIDNYRENGYFPFDMHFHTDYSMDSIADLDCALVRACELNIGIAITDHNSIKGSLKAFKNKYGVPIIPGIEVTSQRGVHTIYYFCKISELMRFFEKELKPNMKHENAVELTTEEILKRSRKYSCITCAPHPFVPGTTGIQKIKITPEIEKNLDVIEGINGYNLVYNNRKAIEWAKKIKKPMSAGSDGHAVFELGKCLTFLQGDSIEEYLHFLIKGKPLILGKEENLFIKLLMAMEKEEKYMFNMHKNHEMISLLKAQFKTEYNFYKNKVVDAEKKLLSYFNVHHT